MKILFLAPSYLNLYIPIQKELERQGHYVTYFEDRFLPPIEWAHSWIRKIIAGSRNPLIVYWRHHLKKEKNLFGTKYDLLLCINGMSFHPILLNRLRRQNPNIRSSLYIWDTSNYLDYFKYYKYFDKVSSFDIDDCEKYNVSLLPFYWLPIQNKKECYSNDYMLSIVGSNHDERLEIVEKIAKQLDNLNLKYCFKIYDAPETSPFHIGKQLPFEETIDIMQRSECILDTDRPTQSGTTPRVIWALALGKKIISTNTNLKRMPFFDNNQIALIDRDTPIIDFDFINKEYIVNNNGTKDYIKNLRIDNWVKQLLPQPTN